MPTGLLLRPSTPPRPAPTVVNGAMSNGFGTVAAAESVRIEESVAQVDSTPDEPVDFLAPSPANRDEPQAEQGKSAATVQTPRARRVKKTYSAAETKGRKLYLPDEIHDRLRLLAFTRREKVSTIAAEILDRNLPRLRIEREG